MIPSCLCLDLEDRGFWGKLFYPICLVQEFRTCAATDWSHFLDESDNFHRLVMRERVKWLDAQRIRYKIHYDVDYTWPDLNHPVVYRLFIEFSSKSSAAAYKLVWS